MTDPVQKFSDALQGKAPVAAQPTKVFYHLYFCPSVDCLKQANPIPGSMHQRGIYSTGEIPHTDVICPGCGGEMKIARNGLADEFKGGKRTGEKVPHPKGHVTTDINGNGEMHGDPIMHEAPGQKPSSEEFRRLA